MKKLMLALGALCAAHGVEATTVAYWKFGERGFADSSGYGNNLTLPVAGGVTLGADGQIVFDGSQKAFLSEKTFKFPNGYTLEFFVRMAKPQSDTGIILELSANTNDGNNHSIGFVDVNDESKPCGLGACYKSKNNVYTTRPAANDVMADGQWHHVALVVDPGLAGTVGVSSFYVDGVQQPTGSHAIGTTYSWDTQQHCVYVGSRGDGNYPFVGEMDDIRVSDGPLSPSEFLQRRTANATAHRVVAHWPFGDKGLQDVSGNGNDLKATDVTLNADGYAAFNGTTSSAKSSQKIDFGTYAGGYTMEFFVRVPADFSTLGMIAELGEDMNANPGTTYIDYGEVKDAFNSGYRSKNGYNGWKTGSVKDGAWHHVAFVVNAENAGTVSLGRFYMDGKLQTQTFFDTTFVKPASHFFYLGMRGGTTFPFRGDVDNVRITAGALDPSAFLPSREVLPATPETTPEAVFDMQGADATIDVPAGAYLAYDRIVTGCDNPNVVLTKTGDGILNVKEPFAGAWNVAGGRVVLPQGGPAPTVKAVAGQSLTLTAKSMTAGTTKDGSFTLAATAANALRPRIAPSAEALPPVKLTGTAKLTLTDETAHGETGLAAATESTVTDLLPQGGDLLGDGGFEDPVVTHQYGYVQLTAPLKGWTPSYPHGLVFQFRQGSTFRQTGTAYSQMAEGLQGLALQSFATNGCSVSHTFQAPVSGIYELRFAAAGWYKENLAYLGDVGVSVALDGTVFHSSRVADDHRGSHYFFKYYAVDLPPVTSGEHTLTIYADGVEASPALLLDDVTLHLVESGDFVPVTNPGFEDLGVMGETPYDVNGWWTMNVSPVGWACTGTLGGWGSTQHSTWSSKITWRTGDELRELRKMYLQTDATASQTVTFPKAGKVRLTLRYAARAMSNWWTGAGTIRGGGHKLVVTVGGAEVGTAWPYSPMLSDLTCEFDVEPGAQKLTLAVDPQGLTDCAAVVDDIRIRYVDEEADGDGWRVTQGTVRTTDGVAWMPYGAAMEKTATAPADGYYFVRFDGTAAAAAAAGGYELRVNGAVAASGRVAGGERIVKTVPVGFLRKDAKVTVGLANLVRGEDSDAEQTSVGLTVNALTLDAPKLQLPLLTFSDALLSLANGTGLVLDYAGKARVGKLEVGGQKMRGSLTAETNPEFLSSAGTLNASLGTSLFVR